MKERKYVKGGGATYKLMHSDNKPRTEAERWRMQLELGLRAMSKQDFDAALSYFEPMWEQGPTGKRREDLSRWLGLARGCAGQPRDAEPLLQKVYAKAPWDRDVGVQLTASLQTLGRLEEAEQCAREMLQLNNKDPMCIVQLSEILTRRRNYDEANKVLLDAKASGISSIRLSLAFAVGAMNSGKGQEAADWILHELNQGGFTPSLEMTANFTLGDVYDKIGNYDKAFTHYTLGNEARESNFDINKNIRKREVAKETWTPELIRKLREFGDPDPRPVFIIGMPRSGTSMTEQVLGRHSKVFPAGELRFARKIPEQILHLFGGAASAMTIGQAFSKLLPGQIRHASQIYTNGISARAGSDYLRVIDKMPGNIWHVGMLAGLLPNAKFIFAKRDPRDICFSCYFRSFRAEHGYSTELKRCGQYCREVFKMADMWSEVLAEATDDKIWMDSVYEKLVSDPETYGKEMYDHVGLEWQSEMADISTDARNVSTLRTDQVGRKIDTKSMERWKRYAKHVGPIEEGLGDILPYVYD